MKNNAKILLVEDDQPLRDMYTLILAKAGYEVETANDGVQGVSAARKGGYDLVLLDLMMPNLDGIGFLKAMKQEGPKTANGPVLILSNAGYDSVAKEAMGLGAQEFLMKAELSPDELVQKVSTYLQ